ncbi:MAG: winged helix-turn-helix transcriptional regulator [Candidatus Bathyarchaeia archaeon]
MIAMREEHGHICFCPLEGVIDVIGRKWALLVVNAIGNYGKLRFKGLMEELKGISPKTLSDTLKRLQVIGLIRREAFSEIPPRVEYSLTDDGLEFRKAIVPLIRWAAKRDSVNGEACSSTFRGIPAHRVRNLAS